jgi:hypothetical protein
MGRYLVTEYLAEGIHGVSPQIFRRGLDWLAAAKLTFHSLRFNNEEFLHE